MTLVVEIMLILFISTNLAKTVFTRRNVKVHYIWTTENQNVL